MNRSHTPYFSAFWLLTVVLSGCVHAADPPAGKMTLWYDKPANSWTEALPVGNGRLGAMVFGGVQGERIQLNEDSLWSGGPQNADNPQALEHLAQVRQLLADGKFVEAEKLAIATMICKGAGSNRGAPPTTPTAPTRHSVTYA